MSHLGVLEDTAIIISADHGEAMGEQAVNGDHVCAGEAVHNIPMIVRWPGLTVGGSCHDGFIYNVDLQPTICELLDIPTPSGWDGRSFADAIRGFEWEGRPHLVWDHALYSCQRAVRTDRWLFLRTYHPGLFPFEDQMLFDMKADPRQTVNLALERPEVVAELDSVMQDWMHEAIGRHGSPPDPMQQVVRTGPWKYVGLEQWIARLREQDRHSDAKAIIDRLDLDENLRARRHRLRA